MRSVRGPEGRDTLADGRARTFLPLVPPAREGALPTAVVIPLRHQLVFTEDGAVDDLAGWTQTLSPGGRLRSLVDFGASSGDRTVTWLVDPALVDAVRRLALGNPPRSLHRTSRPVRTTARTRRTRPASPSPTDEPTASTRRRPRRPRSPPESPLDLDELDPVVQAAAQAAQAWLARLGEAMRPEDAVLTLPYGDVDVAGGRPRRPASSSSARPPRSGHRSARLRRHHHPRGVLPERLPQRRGAAGRPGRLDDPAHRRHVRGPARRRRPPPRAARSSSPRPAPPRADPAPTTGIGITSMRQRLLSEAAVRFLRPERTPLTMVIAPRLEPLRGRRAVLRRPRRRLARPHVRRRRRRGGRRGAGGGRHAALPELAGGRRARRRQLRGRRTR